MESTVFDRLINDQNLRKGRAGTLADWTKTKTADTSSESAMAGERAPNARHSVERIFQLFPAKFSQHSWQTSNPKWSRLFFLLLERTRNLLYIRAEGRVKKTMRLASVNIVGRTRNYCSRPTPVTGSYHRRVPSYTCICEIAYTGTPKPNTGPRVEAGQKEEPNWTGDEGKLLD